MKQYLNGHTVANTVRMTRSQQKGALLLVEGDADIRVYKRFLEENHCSPIPAYNKDNALDALELLEKDRIPGILAIVDADYWHLEDSRPKSANLFITDTHDLETMILSSAEAADKILSEFGSTNRMKQLPHPPLQMVLDAVLPIAFLRWLSQPEKDGLMIKFRELLDPENVEDLTRFIDKSKLKTSVAKLVEAAKKHLSNPGLDTAAIRKKINAYLKKKLPRWQVCSGHDVVHVLTFGFRFVFGNRKCKALKPAMVESMLRMAYEYSHFCSSALYASIKNWEKNNPGYQVLK